MGAVFLDLADNAFEWILTFCTAINVIMEVFAASIGLQIRSKMRLFARTNATPAAQQSHTVVYIDGAPVQNGAPVQTAEPTPVYYANNAGAIPVAQPVAQPVAATPVATAQPYEGRLNAVMQRPRTAHPHLALTEKKEPMPPYMSSSGSSL